MKKITFCLFVILSLVACSGMKAGVGIPLAPAISPLPPVKNDEVRLAWDRSPSTPAATVAGYKVHIGWTSGTYATTLDYRNVDTALVKNLQPGETYYFVVTAYSTMGIESPYSNEVSKQMPMFQKESVFP